MAKKNRKKAPLFPQLGFGLGLRTAHYQDILTGEAACPDWFEVITENFLGTGGHPLWVLEKVRANRPVAFHGESLSVGSADPLCESYLKRLSELVRRFEPAIVSDHACWTGVDGEDLHELLPLPYTRATVRHVARKVLRAQDALKRRILLENVPSHVTYAHSEMQEWEFLAEIAREADCGLLLDVNNVYVNAINHGFDSNQYLRGLPARRIGQIHLAGHSVRKLGEDTRLLLDTHDQPVCDEVWSLYARAIELFGPTSTMIERDARLPAYDDLLAELGRAAELSRWATLPTARPPSRSQDVEAAPGPRSLSGLCSP